MAQKIDGMRKFHFVKLTYTIIWFIFVAAILYVCYAGAFNKVNGLVLCCIKCEKATARIQANKSAKP